jgi:hypothetical protein
LHKEWSHIFKRISVVLKDRKTRLIIKWAILGVIFFFLGKTLYDNWMQLKEYHWRFEPLKLVLSTVLLFGGSLLSVLFWQYDFKVCSKIKPSFLTVYTIINLSNLGRYVPGKLWQFLGIFFLSKKAGISEKQAAVATVISEATQKVSSLIFGLFFLLVFFGDYSYAMALLPVVLGLFFIHPKFLTATINFFLKIMKKNPIDLDFRYSTIVFFLLFNGLIWFVNSTAFFIFAGALVKLRFEFFWFVCLVFPISWTIGWLALFAPGGIGVREGVVSYLLSYFLPLEIAITIAILSRIWLTLVEVVNASVGFYLYKRRFVSDV